MADVSPTRRGKIARLPRNLRDELCHRLADGQGGAEILSWINAQPAAVTMLAKYFKGEKINDANLSAWRTGGYREWRDALEASDSARTNAEFALRVAKASGGNISEGSVAILAGKIIQGLENFDPVTSDPKLWDSAVKNVVALRAAELEGRRIAAVEKKVGFEELRVQRQTAELFIKWVGDQKVKEIAESTTIDQATKVEQLRFRLFGARPDHLAQGKPA